MIMKIIILPIKFRSCLFHPKERTTVWGGHVHIFTSLGDSHLIVGLCKFCDHWSEKTETDLSSNVNCIGCYGYYDGELR